MRRVSLDELRAILERTPAIVQLRHRLSLAFVPEDVQVFETAEELVAALDSPEPQPESPLVALSVDERFAHRLPAVYCDHDPFTNELNRILLPKIEQVQRMVLCQSQVPDRIVQNAKGDCIVLLIVDGLGLSDWKRFGDENLPCEPCFVDGVTVTEHGVMRIVGEPTVALRLAEKGYERSFGFSYWEREKDRLTDRIFFGVTEGVTKVQSFDEVLKALDKFSLEGAFVQVVREGLDQICHRHRDLPDIAGIVRQIAGEFLALAQKLQQRGISATLFLTSDHGILWRHEHELRLYEAGSGNVPPRNYEGLRSGEFLWHVNFKGNDFSVLAYPFIRRQLRSTEWGVHGGLSFEESFIPSVKLTVP
ncbi:MAG: hypothetical protein HZLCBSQH_000090 [Candidatus Fervidibacterota bacterium]